MASAHDAFTADFHDHFTRDPNAAANLGVSRNLDTLPHPSLASADDDVARARALLARIDTMSPDDLDTSLDLDLARLELERQIHDLTCPLDGQRLITRMPRAGDDIGDGMTTLFLNDPRPAEARLADLTGRIADVPRYLAELTDRLVEPVARWVDMDREKVTELPSFFATLRAWADETKWADAPRLASACHDAEAALSAYHDHLATLPTHRDVAVGPSEAERTVALRGIDAPLGELHTMARDFLASTRATIEDLRTKLVNKYDLPADTPTHALREHLDERYRVPTDGRGADAILARYQEEREKILAFIQERDLFAVPDDQNMVITITPGFLAPSIPAGAMAPPPPFRDGVRTSVVYLTLPESRLGEHTDLSIPSMMIHEGIPGHHLQLAAAAAHPSTIRRHVSANDHAEGWTTMLEDYMLDIGYMGDLTDEARFCGKLDISRIGARVAIDLFFMTADPAYLDVGVPCPGDPDPFVAAGHLLRAVTGFSEARTEAELNWYSQERGYPLSYLTGNVLVWQLKRDIVAAQSGKLDGLDLDRAFHRVYLESGNMPVRFLRRVFADRGLLPQA